MKKLRGFLISIILASFVFNFSVTALAGEGTTGDYLADIGTKFGRGLWNTVSSVAEIPCRISEDIKDQGGSGFFTGFGKGILWMLRRILNGVTEVGTFMIPMGPTIPPVCSSK